MSQSISSPSITDPDLSIIIVNWNTRDLLAQSLKSVLDDINHSANLKIETWVVDNASTDGSTQMVQEQFPWVQLIENQKNVGFAAANNVGIRRALAAGAGYAVLLNNDTRVEPGWLDALVSVAEAECSVAICQARQRTWDSRREIRFRFIPEWAEAEQERVPLAPPGPATPTPFASGCAMLLRCSALRHIGLFDRDTTERMLHAGGRIVRRAFNTAHGYRYLGVCREDVRQGTQKAARAEEMLGSLPQEVIDGTLRAAHAPDIRPVSNAMPAHLLDDDEEEEAASEVKPDSVPVQIMGGKTA